MSSGSSVVAVSFKGGVILAADKKVGFGSMCKDEENSRLRELDVSIGTCALAAGGDLADGETLYQTIKEICEEDLLQADGEAQLLGAKEVYAMTKCELYGRRNEFEPLFVKVVIVGFNKEPFVGTVDLIGTSYTEDYLATGFGTHLVVPVLRSAWHPDMTEEEAIALVEKSMEILCYCDKMASRHFDFFVVKDTIRHEHRVAELKYTYDGFQDPRRQGSTLPGFRTKEGDFPSFDDIPEPTPKRTIEGKPF
eukprot:TRINITY_DN4875_c0_g2_i1.p1 TRINITY_DN4875_c0_g2~~TRINITY_DN4875_c0_g2_i1.p1  ORF type:complete len:251 (+),score=43.33 TRINITY_DN4875_c0_g2_i1:106-858(+)